MRDVERARRALGPVGTYVPVPFTRWIPIDEQRKAARRLEAAGYGTTWCNEPVGGKDVFAQLAVLMEATERMAFGTGVANVWARAPQTAHGAAAVLAEAYPDRLVLGLGVGYPEQAAAVGRDFGRPVDTMRAYLDAMAEPPQMPGPGAAYPRIIGANGPKMLALAAAAADGAFPAGQPPEFTAEARRTLGPDKLVVVGLRHNAGDEPAAVAAQVRDHLAAGADHAVLLPATGDDFTADVDRLVHLAPALLS
ncbi:LLM class flavin-dependent oxidoreductase [Actinomadura sp. NPDC048394]|uniref:LLM class flavin-dependent oxidoreductase n=1 Tax=Actinomadura sp. NPDC048394 TaxID=3158223 RepID=UPI0033DCA4C8